MPNYRRVARREARRAGIAPRLFLRQIGMESGFDPGARSPAGAVGIAQIVPRWHPDVDPTRPGNQAPGVDPAADLRYAAQLDARLAQQYGSMRDALSAYNSGKPWAQGKGIAETRNYVESILAGAGPGDESGAGVAAAPAPDASGPDPARVQVAQDLIAALKRRDLAGQIDAMKQLKGTPAPAAGMAPGHRRAPTGVASGGAGDAEVEELIYDPLGSIFDGARSGKPYGGHDDHVHIADDNPQAMIAMIKKALQMGLHVGENPYTTGQVVRSGHAKNSWHKREFKGRYNGKLLGMGGDVSGDPRRMASFFRWVARNYG